MSGEASAESPVWGVSPVSLIPRGPKYKGPAEIKGWEWALMAVTLASVMGVTGVAVDRAVVFAPASIQTLSSDFAFALLLILNALFCAYYVVSGVFRERRLELIALIASIIVVLAYGTVDYALRPSHRTELKLGRLIGSWVLGPVCIALALKVQYTFGWLQFRRVGPSETLQKIYAQRCLYYSLVTLDLQTVLSFFLLGLSAVAEQTVVETIVEEAIGIPFSIAWSLGAYMGVRWERVGWCWAVGLSGVGMPVFAGAASLRLFLASQGSLLLTATALAASLTLALRLVFYLELALCVRNFDKGLLQAFREA